MQLKDHDDPDGTKTTTFQFQEVQLKVKEKLKAEKEKSAFQFQEVQLKVAILVDALPSIYVSIPRGAVKSPTASRHPTKSKVSIPRGAVKSIRAIVQSCRKSQFQFQEVQLKEAALCCRNLPQNGFNSKRCS